MLIDDPFCVRKESRSEDGVHDKITEFFNFYGHINDTRGYLYCIGIFQLPWCRYGEVNVVVEFDDDNGTPQRFIVRVALRDVEFYFLLYYGPSAQVYPFRIYSFDAFS